ncbi:universal stress protein [Dactylosporangium sp. NPDC005555]|uniref:universal stress protein n=1 Tax=Dactylosporangium sp. NPDC005555 TaxID=3154889 RepID=UPI00339DFCC7
MTRSPAAIVVGVDGTDEGERAVRWAAADAARRGRRLHLFHACSGPTLVHPPPGLWLPVAGAPRPTPHAARLLQDAEGIAHAIHADLPVTAESVGGQPVPALLEASEYAAAIVVGRRGTGTFGALVAGSTAAEIAEFAACPVVVVRADTSAGGRYAGRVVVGIDTTEPSEEAIGFAFEQALARGTGVTAVHAYHPPADPMAGCMVPGSFDLGARCDTAQRLLSEILSTWRERHPEVGVRSVVELGGATGVLMRASMGAALLVVGAHGYGPFGGLVLGSVSRAMLHRAPCPVAVVRATARRGTLLT